MPHYLWPGSLEPDCRSGKIKRNAICPYRAILPGPRLPGSVRERYSATRWMASRCSEAATMSRGAWMYFHSPCFDGIISAVIASDFLESRAGWKFERFRPVDYNIKAN